MPVAFGGVDLAEMAAWVGELLAVAGVAATPERRGRFAAAIALSRPASLDELYWLGRLTLVSDWPEIAVWDGVFGQVFRGFADVAEFRGEVPSPAPKGARDLAAGEGREQSRRALPSDSEAPSPPLTASDGASEDSAGEGVMAAASDVERLRTRDFASLTPGELVALRLLMSRLAVVTPPRRARRRVRAPSGSHIDLRATLRRAQRTGADPVIHEYRRNRTRPRRLVMLCDVSGSMEPYSRAYLQLLLSAVGGARAEAFVFATRLTRVSRQLRALNPDLALERAGKAAPDWAGGTRIGAAMKTFNDEYGRRGMARGAVVVVISDGWELGDPSLLEREMSRLRLLAHHVIWVNPRQASETFRPLTAGMQAALPHVQTFLSGHSMEAVERLLEAIAGARVLSGVSG